MSFLKQIKAVALLTLLLALPAPAIAKDYPFNPGPTGPVTDWELILDREFAVGFEVIKNCANPDKEPECAASPRAVIRNPFHPQHADAKPLWDIAEWGSKANLSGPGTVEGKSVSWANNYKRFVVHPDNRLELAVNAQNEYDGKYPADWEKRKWAHLLLGQMIAMPGTYSRPSGSLADMTKLQLSIDVRKVYEDQNKKEGYNPDRHAAFFPISIMVQNLTKDHPGFGQYVWLQAVFYDDRFPMPGGLNAVDGGTGSLMYPIPYKDFGAPSTHAGNWVHLEKDILPYARRGIKQAADAGLIKSGDMNHYHIGAFNIGYEVPGMNISTFEFKNLSLKVSASNLYTPGGLHTDMNSINGKTQVPAATATVTSTDTATATSTATAVDETSAKTKPLYRSYNAATGDHLFSESKTEGAGAYAYEGVAFNLFANEGKAGDRNPLYRCLKEDGKHFLSASDTCEGYTREGILGYIGRDASPGAKTPLYRCYSSSTNRHLITTGKSECEDNNFTVEGMLGYIP